MLYNVKKTHQHIERMIQVVPFFNSFDGTLANILAPVTAAAIHMHQWSATNRKWYKYMSRYSGSVNMLKDFSGFGFLIFGVR